MGYNVIWLEALEVGDEVCVTNIRNLSATSKVLGSLHDGVKIDEICEIETLRGILSDGTFVVGNKFFKPNGEEESSESMSELKLCQPTNDFIEKAARLMFFEDIKRIDWDNIDTNTMCQIVNLCNKSAEESNSKKEGA